MLLKPARHDFTITSHVLGYAALCGVMIVAWLPLGRNVTSSAALSPALMAASAICIALIGVPHGGLDHWVGRRLLACSSGKAWPFVFFPAYLLCGISVAFVWMMIPVVTILSFLVVSAWHFGREEDRDQSAWLAIASGGMVIWIIAWARPAEMSAIMSGLLIPGDASASVIVRATQVLGCFFAPLALWGDLTSVRKPKLLQSNPHSHRWLVRLATIAVACFTPILVSFTAYFCFWHSLLGLRRLRREESLKLGPFLAYVAPMSMTAVALVFAAGWWLGGFSLQNLSLNAGLRMTFIGLAAIAVPHIFLHEGETWLRKQLWTQRYAIGVEGNS